MNDLMASITATERKEVRREVKAEAAQNKKAQNSNAKASGPRVPTPPAKAAKAKFALEPFESIRFESNEEWLVKRLIPKQGAGAFYGASQSFKTFIMFDIALHVACGWTGRLAASPKRQWSTSRRRARWAYESARSVSSTSTNNSPESVPFYLISAAPNWNRTRRFGGFNSFDRSRRRQAWTGHHRYARSINRRGRRKRRRHDPIQPMQPRSPITSNALLRLCIM